MSMLMREWTRCHELSQPRPLELSNLVAVEIALLRNCNVSLLSVVRKALIGCRSWKAIPNKKNIIKSGSEI